MQQLWRSANRALNAQLVAFIEGDTTRLQSTGGAVVLNVDQLVADVAGSGAAGAVEGRVQPIVVLQADQLSTAQTAVKALKTLSFWPLIIGLLLWAGAVYWSARRRLTVRNIALSLALMGLLILAILRVAGNAIVDNLVQTESVRPAASDAWTILTSLLAQSATAGIFIGLVAIIGIWFSGPGRRATAGRRWLAPFFRDHPLIVHGTLAVLLLVLLAWGPAGTPRRLIGIVIVVILAFVGLEVLRRQTVREFPDAVANYDLNPFSRRRRGGAGRRARRKPRAAGCAPRERRADRRGVRGREGPARRSVASRAPETTAELSGVFRCASVHPVPEAVRLVAQVGAAAHDPMRPGIGGPCGSTLGDVR